MLDRLRTANRTANLWQDARRAVSSIQTTTAISAVEASTGSEN
ncbi:hypothetical protein [Bradyrhizobium sp. HKCCYLS20291]